jgi:Na+-transporting methylmalonyl-CoA/oxaloacetate decarboxylase gamma subunit
MTMLGGTFAALTVLEALPQAASGTREALELAVVGMGVVFTVLAVIGGLLVLLGKVFAAPGEEAVETPPAPPRPAAAPAHTTAPPGHVDPQTLAVLTAAAYAAVGRPVRIRRVTFINENTVSAWKEVGRATIQASHNIKRSL